MTSNRPTENDLPTLEDMRDTLARQADVNGER